MSLGPGVQSHPVRSCTWSGTHPTATISEARAPRGPWWSWLLGLYGEATAGGWVATHWPQAKAGAGGLGWLGVHGRVATRIPTILLTFCLLCGGEVYF
jgi:hypothetical protein